MRLTLSPRKAAFAAAIKCFSLLALCLVPTSTVTERPGRPVRHSRLSGDNDNVGDLSQLGEQNIIEGDAASRLMPLGQYGHQGKVEGESRILTFRRQRRRSSSTSMSPHRGKLPRRSPFNKSTRRPSKTFIIPALIAVAVLVLWQVGNVFVKCLERANTVKHRRAHGSIPRSLSDTHRTPANLQTLCNDVGVDILLEMSESAPLLGPGEGDSDEDRKAGWGSSEHADVESAVDRTRVQTRSLDRSMRLILPVFVVLLVMVILLNLPLDKWAAHTKSTSGAPTESSHALSTTTPAEDASSSPGSNTATPSSNPTSASSVTVTTSSGERAATAGWSTAAPSTPTSAPDVAVPASAGGSAATASSSSSLSSQPSTKSSSTAASSELLFSTVETSPSSTAGLLSPPSSPTGGATSTSSGASFPPSLSALPSSTTPGASSFPSAVEGSSPVPPKAPSLSHETAVFSSGDLPSVTSTTSLSAETPTVNQRSPQNRY